MCRVCWYDGPRGFSKLYERSRRDCPDNMTKDVNFENPTRYGRCCTVELNKRKLFNSRYSSYPWSNSPPGPVLKSGESCPCEKTKDGESNRETKDGPSMWFPSQLLQILGRKATTSPPAAAKGRGGRGARRARR